MNKAEEQFQRKVRELGCVVCRLFMGLRTDCDIHHILNGGRRISEMAVLGLCPAHHRGGFNDETCVSRHPYKAAWVRRYGTEDSLLERTKELIA